MRGVLAVLLLLAGCAGGDQGSDPGDGAARVRLNGAYTAFGVGAMHR